MALKKNLAWRLDERKFLSKNEIKKLLRVMLKEKEKAKKKKIQTPVKDWFLVELAINTGLRVSEIVELNCGDFFIERCFVLIRKGKGGKERIVKFSRKFKSEIEEYIKWKKTINEGIDKSDPVFYSSRTNSRITKRALQKAFKRCLKKAKIPEDKYSIHCLRHTYASYLYKESRYNLRLVQLQLGHSSIKVTEVYAQVLDPDLEKAVEKLFR